MATADDIREALDTVMEPYFETRLFHDMNIPRVNELYSQMLDELTAVAHGFRR